MMLRIGIAVLGFWVVSVDAGMRLRSPDLERLPNGLEVAWFQDDSIPVTDFVFLFRSGTRQDPPGKSGTLQLLGQLLDRGAGGRTAVELAKEIEQYGGSHTVTVDQDVMIVGTSGLSPDAEKLLSFLSNLVVHPDFPEAEVKRERDRILERWVRGVDFSEALAALGFSRWVAAGTEYARGGLTDSTELKQVMREDLVRFHQRILIPSNAILTIVGRFDRPTIRKKIEELFQKPGTRWETPKTSFPKMVGPKVIWKDPKIPVLGKNEVLLIHRPKLTQVQIRYGFRSIPARNPDRVPLSVVNALFGEYFESRLNRVVRDQMGLTYGVGSSFDFEKDFGSFVISASTRNEHVAQVVSKLKEMLVELRTSNPITAGELQIAKEYLKGQFPLTVATLQGVAVRWMTGIVFDLGPNYLNEFLDSVDRVTLEQAQTAVKKHMHTESTVMVVAGDATQITPVLKKAGIRFKQVQASELLR